VHFSFRTYICLFLSKQYLHYLSVELCLFYIVLLATIPHLSFIVLEIYIGFIILHLKL
jgi:hypothetical protein